MNNQQQQDAFYGGYQISGPARSPSSTRQGYNTSGGHSGGNRPTQRQLDPIPHLSASFYPEDPFTPFDSIPRQNRMPPTQGFANSFILGNNQPWHYNAGAAVTINGPMADGVRLRAANRSRLPLPNVRASSSVSANPSFHY
jgi:hypothetical protein